MPRPEISVIISTYQRPRKLVDALRALARQDYPCDAFEVIVVNDGGREPLEGVVKLFERDLHIHLLNCSNGGPGAGRNAGVAEARAAVIAFTDDDCEPEPGWLRAIKAGTDRAPGCLLGGKTVAGLPGQVCLAASQMIQDVVYDFYNDPPDRARFFASNNMAMPADGFRELGGFDPEFRIASEDRDLCERWRMSGRRMVYLPDAVVRHCHRLGLSGFLRQHFRYGRGACHFHRKRARQVLRSLRDHMSMHSEWYVWLFRPWREASGVRAVQLHLLLILWQLANLAGFAYAWLFDDLRKRRTAGEAEPPPS